jgi:glycosyltransferase involved in cell wall biosynthesis
VSKSANQPWRWWIIEDALRDHKGHWFEYLRTFQRGLAAQGDEVHFFASKECAGDVARAFKAEPILPKSIWARISDGAPKWRRLIRIPTHGFATYRAVSRLIAECCAPRAPFRPAGPPSRSLSSNLHANRSLPDLIFVPTVLVHHLVGWVPLIRWKLRNFHGKVLLFFPNAPMVLREDGSADLSPDPTAKLFRIYIRALAKDVAKGKAILGAETKPMAKALSKATGVPFIYLPHPVDLPEARESDAHRQFPAFAAAEAPVVFGCYGAARHEKGSDILQRAVRLALEEKPDLPAFFTFQWVEGFSDGSGEAVQLDPWLDRHPKVRVIKHYFSEGEYERQLASTDVMILPYRDPYRLRVSRVVIEAMRLGVPVVTTKNTTLADQAGEFGSVLVCEQDSARSLARTISQAVTDHAQLVQRAGAGAVAAREHFSVSSFREILLRSWLS